ncbi:MAG: NADH-quinone oxidoreductase subunit J [Chloroflexi bacterium]|jgi:NADH-quinone oxidoreductase subunit J|uniref:NADH-quinone oxidoreductase subunit J n=1 Tax=Candidatus Thermofonsia Clade 3 bacterium TaxID=2364212 RepID=A0A2M8QFC6_9CHLR|nr:NADH-quinone oxidoreductase subunit J [Candidatus Roseilinea sp. NK_OTU-006]PJF48515.1 MAG: NADH-quinone oxidoreductase subunit J [Candidatus Thermofonsia Clade 3 bacterium]RMG62147.1 MAG: NADH-quinone oxidoreductase subunit J [Chloroflexota bacterium]
MTPDLPILIVLGAVSIASALGLLLSRNAIYAALFLVLNFGVGAVIYLVLNAPFIAVVQVSVYAGAIMVLFLFVIMLLGAERLSPGENPPGISFQRPLAIALGGVLLGLALYALFVRQPPTTATALADSSPTAIGLSLFGPYLFPFEVVSILLLVAMVGAVVLTRNR